MPGTILNTLHLLTYLILTFLTRKVTLRNLLAKGHRGAPKQTQDSTPGYMALGITLLHSTVRAWEVGTIETYTEELNEIIKVIG